MLANEIKSKAKPTRINRISDLPRFLRCWDDAAAEQNLTPVHLHFSRFGNINGSGRLGDYDGHALSQWHVQFEKSLEAGIRELVLFLVRSFGWITYTSCQGHLYQDTECPPVERHVGLMPRSRRELEEMRVILDSVALAVNSHLVNLAIRVEALGVDLESDNRSYPAIDFVFLLRPGFSWESYFGQLAQVQCRLLTELEGHAPLTNSRASAVVTKPSVTPRQGRLRKP